MDFFEHPPAVKTHLFNQEKCHLAHWKTNILFEDLSQAKYIII